MPGHVRHEISIRCGRFGLPGRPADHQGSVSFPGFRVVVLVGTEPAEPLDLAFRHKRDGLFPGHSDIVADAPTSSAQAPAPIPTVAANAGGQDVTANVRPEQATPSRVRLNVPVADIPTT